MNRFHALRDAFLDLLFPEPVGCLVCRKEGEASLCEDCRAELYRNGPRQCEICGRTIQTGAVCSVCSKQHFTLLCREIRILYRYDGTVRRMVRQAKFGGSRYSVKAMAELLADEIEMWETPPEALLFVPSHPLRIFQRGYCSTEIIARLIGERLDIPVEARALRRVRYSPPQSSQPPERRAEQVRGAFAKGTLSKPYEHCLLLDDVCTSGSTLWEVLSTLDMGDRLSVLVLSGHEE